VAQILAAGQLEQNAGNMRERDSQIDDDFLNFYLILFIAFVLICFIFGFFF